MRKRRGRSPHAILACAHLVFLMLFLCFEHANLHIIYYKSAKEDQNIYHGMKKDERLKQSQQTVSSFIFHLCVCLKKSVWANSGVDYSRLFAVRSCAWPQRGRGEPLIKSWYYKLPPITQFPILSPLEKFRYASIEHTRSVHIPSPQGEGLGWGL